MPTKIAIFSQAQLDAHIQTLMADVPSDHHSAIVAAVDQLGASIGLRYGSSNGVWVIEGVASHAWSGENSVGGKVIASW